MQQISAAELAERLQNHAPILLDVREPEEFAIAHIANSISMPMGDVSQRYQELEDDAEIICICHHGIRSAHVVNYLLHQGFEHVINLSGGIDAWAQHVDTNMQRY